MLLNTFVDTLHQKGLLDRHIVSSVCDSGVEQDRKWEALHEFVALNKAAIEKAELSNLAGFPEDDSPQYCDLCGTRMKGGKCTSVGLGCRNC
jgi:hypothetical protein